MKSKTTQHNTALHRMRFRRIGELFVGSRNLKSFSALALLCLVSIGCSQKPPQAPSVALPNGLQSRFEDYCDYTGGLGIGFVAWHTYDYRFRQHLKRTQDPELKRLYVLENLHRGTAVAIDNLEKGITWTSKSSSRPLTTAEWEAERHRIGEQIEELARYTAFTNYAISTRDFMDDPDPHLMFWVDGLRQALRGITNAPGANSQSEANGTQPFRSDANRSPAGAGPRH